MNSSNFRFILDLHSTQSQISIPVTKGDTARVWYISLSDGGLPYTIVDGCLADMNIKRPDGRFIQALCVIEHNTTIKYDFAQNVSTAAEEGVHDCSVILSKGGQIIGSPRFTMVVSGRTVDNGDINIEKDDIDFIDALRSEAADWDDNETKRENNEVVRQRKETERQTEEDTRQSNETTRQETLEHMRGVVSQCEDIATRCEDVMDQFEDAHVTEADNGKFMRVVNGKWAAVTIPDAEGEEY